MRIAVVQFAPKIGHVQDNINMVWKLCEKLKPHSLDIVCLPEMVFTGYAFPNAMSISPYLEEPRVGPTSKFCSELAARLHCYVAAGYPERLPPREIETTAGAQDSETSKIGANSAVVYDPDGQWVGDYRKTNLFETDMTWAKAGTGFATFTLPHPLNTVSLGICMDLNVQPPAEWTLDEGPYEMADYCIAKKTNTLIMLNAWLDSGVDGNEDRDWQTLNYWAARLRPLWAKATGVSMPNSQKDAEDETVVVICNRCGEENGKRFAGSSALFSLQRESGRPRLLHAMGRQEEGVEVWEVPSRRIDLPE
ncbi:hypothetical protein AcW1_007414 [Taiwanofungus camphoratus]|nr:hypothetical protein AcW2_007525 [Antrodia cinnamomea]KAI0947093.1 hypothetical protein AcV7_009615 [Antrodia cinnamomea]KAI0953098.1 hypothetical protein AcW1_007414 [Antrodia cinnamomea]